MHVVERWRDARENAFEIRAACKRGGRARMGNCVPEQGGDAEGPNCRHSVRATSVKKSQEDGDAFMVAV
jgi:hypothetical protein